MVEIEGSSWERHLNTVLTCVGFFFFSPVNKISIFCFREAFWLRVVLTHCFYFMKLPRSQGSCGRWCYFTSSSEGVLHTLLAPYSHRHLPATEEGALAQPPSLLIIMPGQLIWIPLAVEQKLSLFHCYLLLLRSQCRSLACLGQVINTHWHLYLL